MTVSSMRTIRSTLPLALAAALLAGCRTERSLVVHSAPPGALVRLDEALIGRTPLDHPFEHHGTRRLTLYLPGYRTHSEQVELPAPWHARFPIDLITEVLLPLGLDDKHEFSFVLEPDDIAPETPEFESLLERAEALRDAALAQYAEEQAAFEDASEGAESGGGSAGDEE